MRALILALAMAGTGAAASAASPGISNGQGDTVAVSAPTPRAPEGVRKQAEDAVMHDLGDQGSATFRAVRVMEAATIRHDPFAKRIDGPVSVVCGQYNPQGRAGGDGGYIWFLVAIKGGRVLWTTDNVTAGPDEAYNSCKGAGLADQSMATTGAFR